MPSSSSRRHVTAALLVALATSVATLATTAVVTADPAGAADPAPVEHEVATMVNRYRAAHGKPALHLDPGMSDDARVWSAHLASRGDLAHDPELRSTCDRFPGWYQCTENVGYAGDAAGVQVAFEQSGAHAANLLCDCTHVGVGVVSSGGRTWVTQRFVGAGAVAAPMTAAQETSARTFVDAAYRDFLGRPPTAAELDHWITRVGTTDARAALVRALASSDHWLGGVVDGYYQVALGRVADDGARRHWIDAIRSGVARPSAVAAGLYASDEYFARLGNDLGRWIDTLYRALLQRVADPTGRDHWVRTAAAVGRLPVARDFHDSPETLGRRIDALYRRLLGRAVDAPGLAQWSGLLRWSQSDVVVAIALASSDEYLERAQHR